MRLTLRLVSFQRNALGQQAEVIFEGRGGVIGRSRQCDWYLPDAERVVSSQHALIEFADGAYFISDTSTNGLFINGSSAPLGRGNSYRLQSGDTIALGEYLAEVIVEPMAQHALPSYSYAAPVQPIVANTPQEPDPLDLLIQQLADAKPLASAQVDYRAPEPAPVARPAVESTPIAIPNDWDAELLDMVHPVAPPPIDAGNAPAKSEPVAPIAAAEPVKAPVVDLAHVPAATSVVQSAPPVARESDHHLASGNESVAIAAFIRGLGIDPGQIAPERMAEFMQAAGEALRESIAGILDALRTRTIIKSEIQASQTMIRAGENNALKLSVSVDDAIFNLFTKNVRGFLPPVASIHEALHDIKAHPVGLMAGTEAVIKQVLNHLDPEQIALPLERGSILDKVSQGSQAARCWKVYIERHHALVQEVEAASHVIFPQQFSAAYESQMDELKREAMRQYYQQPLF